MSALAPAPAERPVPARSVLRSVAVPAEHGGWGLTTEPVLLGLLVAPSAAGLALGLAALLAFLCRTPLKLAAVDRRRGRRSARTTLAARVAAVELLAIVGLVTLALVTAEAAFWWPVVVAAPFVAVELWFDVRSRSRRLVPELAGAIGVSGAAAAIALAGGAGPRVALGAWLVLAARSIAAIPFVRAQIFRSRRGVRPGRALDVAFAAAVLVAGLAVVCDRSLLGGAVAVAALVVVHAASLRRPVPAIKVVGIRQMVAGFAVVAATAAGVALA